MGNNHSSPQSSSPIIATDQPISLTLGSTDAIPIHQSSYPHSPLSSCPSPSPSSSLSLHSYLSRFLLDIVPHPLTHPVCMLNHDDTVLDILMTFNRHNITSIPILMGLYSYAVVDYIDILHFFGHALINHYSTSPNNPFLLDNLLTTPCSSLVNISNSNSTISVPLNYPIFSTVKKMISCQAKRLLLLDPDSNNELYQLVTHTRILSYFLTILPIILPSNISPSDSLTKLQWFGGSPPLYTVPSHTSIIDAITKCLDWGVHRVPVTFPILDNNTNSNTKPRVGLFGAWDFCQWIISLSRNHRSSPSSSAVTLLNNNNISSISVCQVCSEAVIVDLDDSLHKIISILSTRSREVILVDESMQPIHIITQGDCLRFLFKLISDNNNLSQLESINN